MPRKHAIGEVVKVESHVWSEYVNGYGVVCAYEQGMYQVCMIKPFLFRPVPHWYSSRTSSAPLRRWFYTRELSKAPEEAATWDGTIPNWRLHDYAEKLKSGVSFYNRDQRLRNVSDTLSALLKTGVDSAHSRVPFSPSYFDISMRSARTTKVFL